MGKLALGFTNTSDLNFSMVGWTKAILMPRSCESWIYNSFKAAVDIDIELVCFAACGILKELRHNF